jgi:carbohydrate-selective porin OprB
MKKKVPLLLTALFLLALASAASSSLPWSTGSLEDALAKAKASGKLLLLDFFQEYG